jgi:HlyD family secretion protein
LKPDRRLLDPRTRAEAEARLKAAEAVRLQRRAEVGRARDALDLARKDFARTDDLQRRGVVARQQWDTAENRVRVLTAR